MKDSIRGFDKSIGDSVARLPKWLRPLMELFTLIGQPPFTVGAAALVLGYGYALNKPYYLDAGLIAIITLAIAGLLKMSLRRTRPVTEYVKNMLFQSYSFPSGHAAGSLVSYGMLAAAVSARWPDVSIVAWTAALITILIISLSRIYLGAHYASDIIGGWIVGGAGLLVILLMDK
jgi:undecaprenyl-diphosphatase